MRLHFDIERERSKELFKEISNDNIDGQCHFNFHSQIELYFVDEGQIDAFVNQQQRRLSKGQMAVVLSYDAHLFRSVGSSRSSILVIPPDLCREFMSAVQYKQVKNPFICDEATVSRIKFFVDAIKTDNTNEVKLRGYLYVVLGIVLENIFLKSTEFSVDTELSSKLLFYLNQHFRNEITLNDLSCTFGYSPSYLSRYFKDRFGVGLNQYVNILRLRNALLLMQEGKYTHTYCALESGFTSMRTFYRVFKQEFGCAPRDYISVLGSQL
jgi:AraC-like DNA-binding protein